MLEKIEYKGMWFLPENPEIEVAGTLYYYPNEEIKLELIGSFQSKGFNDIISNATSIVKVIHGTVYGEKRLEKISLFNCSPSMQKFFSSNFLLTKYTCQLMFIGKHVSDLKKKTFDKVRIKFPCMMDWYSNNPLEFTIHYDELDKSVTEYQWKMKTKDKRFRKKFTIDDNTDLYLDSTCGFQQKNYTFDMYGNAHIEIVAKQKESFEEFYSLANLFKDFLSLAVLSEVFFTEIILFDDDDFQEYSNGEKSHFSVSVFFITPKLSSTKYSRHDFLFLYKDIEANFAKVIKKWYAEKDKLAPIRTRLIDSLTYKKTFDSIDFLIVIQSLQGFYYRYIDKNDKINLKTQLENLYDKFRDIPFVANNPMDYDKVRDSRHYYSHFFGEEKKKNICSGLELYDITQNLKLLLLCCVLSLLGFDNNSIDNLLRKSNKLSWDYSVKD